MSWSSHIDYLCNKVSSRIGILKRIMPCLTLPSAQTMYKSTIQPLFDYCGVVWDTCSETSSLRLQRLQNRGGRVILLTDNCNSSASVRAKLNWSTLQQRRKYNKAILTYKCLNNQLEGLDTNYLRHSEIHSYNTRNKDKFVLPKPRSEYMKRTFKYTSITLWNTLSKNIQNSDSVSSFKRQISKILL